MKFNYKGPCSLGARGFWSANQESLISTRLHHGLVSGRLALASRSTPY